MESEIKELKNTALRNREHIIYKKTLIPSINGNKRTSLAITGIGQKTIKLTAYVSYEDILEFKNESESLESELYKIINTIY